MNDDILPIWHDHGAKRSTLVYWTDDKELTPHGPKSIVKLCQEIGLKQCVAVSDTFSTFIEAYKAFDKVGIQYVFGLDLIVGGDLSIKSDDGKKLESKVTIFIRNSQGYQDLIKLFTDCHTNPDRKVNGRISSYYRYDWGALKKMWTDNLSLALPFFDSPIARNSTVWGSQIIPDFPVLPILFREVAAQHPMEQTINAALDEFNKDGRCVEQRVKNIYYARRADLKANMMYRTIHRKSSFAKPELEFFCSPEFCVESFLELTGRPPLKEIVQKPVEEKPADGYVVSDETGKTVAVGEPAFV